MQAASHWVSQGLLQELKQRHDVSQLEMLSEAAEKLSESRSTRESVHLQELQEELLDLEALQREASAGSAEDQASLRGKIQQAQNRSNVEVLRV